MAPGLAVVALGSTAIYLARGLERQAASFACVAASVSAIALGIDPELNHAACLLVAVSCMVGHLRSSTRPASAFLAAIGGSFAIASGIASAMGISGRPVVGMVGPIAMGLSFAAVFLAQFPSLAGTRRAFSLPVLCFLSVLSLTFVMAEETRQGGFREAHRSAQRSTGLLVQSLNRALELRRRAVERVAALYEIGQPADLAFWRVQANSLIRDFPGLTTIERVDANGQLEWLIPFNPPPEQQQQLNSDPFRQKVIFDQLSDAKPGLGPVLVMRNGHKGVLQVAPTNSNGTPNGAILGLIDLLATSDLVLSHAVINREAVSIFFGSEIIQQRRREAKIEGHGATLQTGQFGVEVAPTLASLPAAATVLPLAILFVGVVMSLKLALIVRFAIIARQSLGDLRIANDRVVAEREQLKSAIDVARLGVWQYSVADRTATVDARSAEVLGLKTDGDSLEVPLFDWLEFEPDAAEAFNGRLERGEAISDEVRVRTPNGVTKLVGLYGHSSKDASGAVVGFTGVLADVDEQRATELQLAKSNAKFQAMLESSPLGIFLTEPDGTCTYTNAAYDQISGLPPAASRGYSCLLGVHSEDRGRVSSEWFKAIEGLKPIATTFRFSWIDGTVRDCAIQASPIWVGSEVIGFIGFLQDITDRLRSQDELKRARDRVEALLNSTNAVVHSLKPFGTFSPTYVTPNVAEIFGLSPSELLHSNEYLFQRIHEDDLELFTTLNEQVLRAGTATVEYRILDGSDSYRWVRDSRNLIFDGEQRPVEIAGYWIDITPQRLAEEALREKSAINEAMLETANYGIMTTRPDGTITSVNPAVSEILGVKPTDLVGQRTLDSLYLKEELKVCAEQASRVLGVAFEPNFTALIAMVENGVADVDNWTLVGADGKQVPVTVSLSRIVLTDGSLIGYMAILQDDTERRLYQSQIDHQMTQLSEARLMLEEQQFELHAKNLELERLATTDGLTGLLNRRALMERLRHAIALSDRHGQDISILMMDVDHFKAYNDSFGHPAGDEVLRRVAEVIRQSSRTTDVSGRYGGEEFVLVLPETGVEGGLMLAERIRTSIETHDWPNRPITASIGVCTRHEGENDEALLTRVDEALYESKRAGRNRVSVSSQKAA
ncbi:MAG: hypothetical protein HONBIEJF_01931 [Fimbriimonadaceae bacterium]|nr:hypothetical protein [Fimbriimonadaceae bacterium]